MKILLVSDIHSDYNAARSLLHLVNPDFVLDCGDHKEIKNLFELTPHFYIHGNHEPSQVESSEDGMPLPFKIPPGQIVVLRKDGLSIRVAGLDGNYSSQDKPYSVKPYDVERLKRIPQKGIDLFLTHESPLLVKRNSSHFALAREVVSEIDRIQPKYVVSGHYKYSNSVKTPNEIPNTVLDPIVKGYCVLDGETFLIRREKLVFR